MEGGQGGGRKERGRRAGETKGRRRGEGALGGVKGMGGSVAGRGEGRRGEGEAGGLTTQWPRESNFGTYRLPRLIGRNSFEFPARHGAIA